MKKGILLRHKDIGVVLAAFLFIIISLGLVYAPGLNGPYVLDDGENIATNKAVSIDNLSVQEIQRAALASESGPFKRPLASISFALNGYFAGGFDDSFPLKLTNLVIHIVNSVLVAYLAWLLTQSPVLRDRLAASHRRIAAMLTAAFWALHPIQLTNVLYVVQRMNSLSALFVVAGLALFLSGRLRMMNGKQHGLTFMTVGILVGLTFGIATKENAALIPLFALIIECLLFRDIFTRNTKIQKSLIGFYAAMIALPLTIFVLYLTLNPSFITESYAHRSFTPCERLLTEVRVLWFYLSLILLPLIHRFNLFHDDISLSTGLITPPTTIVATLGLVIITVLIFSQARRRPLISFATAWFLGGHALESSIFSLELAYEHRNYLPSIGIFFAISCSLMMLLINSRLKKLLVVLIAGLLVSLGLSTRSLANTWKTLDGLADTLVRLRPDSPKANNFAAHVNLLRGDIASAIYYTSQELKLSPNEPGGYINLQIELALLTPHVVTQTQYMLKRGMDPADIAIRDLPECVRIKKENRFWRLTCDTASSEIIQSLLRVNPVTVYTSTSLTNLRICITSRKTGCELLIPDALRWLETASINIRTHKSLKEKVLMDTALLYAFVGDYQKALTYLRQASDLSPHILAYQLGQIEYLIILGQRDRAFKLLDNVISNRNVSDIQLAINKKSIDTLRAMLTNIKRDNP